LQNLLAHPGEIVIAVDAAWQGRKRKDEYLDYVTASHSYTPRYGEEEAELRDIGPKIGKIDGEWIGLLKASPSGTEKIHETLKELSGRADFRTLRCDALLRELVSKGVRISIVYITGHWLDVDNLDDLSAANATGI
jgi:phosphoenolpyruvate phosphomutase